MTGAVKELTDKFDLEIPEFDFPSWHTYYTRNLKAIDAILYLITGSSSVRGAWKNSTIYLVGDRVIDVDQSKAFEASVEHTSAAGPTTFAQDRATNPTYWQEVNIITSLIGTSVSSIVIGTGSKVFATQSGRLFTNGTKVMITSASDPVNNYMWGTVSSYVGSTLTVSVTVANGAGTHADWTISVSGERGPTGPSGSGEVSSTGSATDNALVRADGASMDVIQGSVITVDDTGNLRGALTLGILDSDSSHHLIIDCSANLTADRTLFIDLQNTTRTLTMIGDAFLSGTNTGDSGIATQAEMEAASDLVKISPPGRIRNSPYAAKAWVKFDNSGTVAASAGVSSVTDVGTGQWTVNLTNSFSSSDYIGVVTILDPGVARIPSGGPLSVNTFAVRSYSDAGAAADGSGVMVVFFGDL